MVYSYSDRKPNGHCNPSRVLLLSWAREEPPPHLCSVYSLRMMDRHTDGVSPLSWKVTNEPRTGNNAYAVWVRNECKLTSVVCLTQLNSHSKTRLQLFVNPNILWEQICAVQTNRWIIPETIHFAYREMITHDDTFHLSPPL